MMVIGLYTNTDRDIDCKITRQVVNYLQSLSVEYIAIPERICDSEQEIMAFDSAVKQCDIILTFGGDGTVLKVLQCVSDKGIPVMGINLGGLGFLTESNTQEMLDAIDSILDNRYEVVERIVVKICCDGKCYFAVNDMTLTRGQSVHTLGVEVQIDGKLADVVKGDGVLISTPLGSTAYSLSCGGPIISPELKVLAVIAVCPHSLHSRPMVISDDSRIKLVINNRDGLARLSIDSNSYELPKGELIVDVSKSDYSAKLIRIKQENFYNKLINKLYRWNDLCRRE